MSRCSLTRMLGGTKSFRIRRRPTPSVSSIRCGAEAAPVTCMTASLKRDVADDDEGCTSLLAVCSGALFSAPSCTTYLTPRQLMNIFGVGAAGCRASERGVRAERVPACAQRRDQRRAPGGTVRFLQQQDRPGAAPSGDHAPPVSVMLLASIHQAFHCSWQRAAAYAGI
jgi:hypothetical protein